MTETVETNTIIETPVATFRARLSDAVSFWGVILLSALAIALIAFATPIVLLISAIVGLSGGDKSRSTWRPAKPLKA